MLEMQVNGLIKEARFAEFSTTNQLASSRGADSISLYGKMALLNLKQQLATRLHHHYHGHSRKLFKKGFTQDDC